MASFYSKPAEYGTYTQPINLEMVNFVMASRQQKYDYNLAKIESKIADQLGSLDLARDQDKEYFLKRAEQVLGGMGDLSKLDWSKNGVTRQVDNQINSIIDDRVLNDVVSTKNFRAFQRTLQEKQKENDGTYNPVNAAYAMETQGVNAWLRGTTDSVGSINYQDYTDVNTELRDISENLDKYAKEFKTFTDPEGQRRYMTTEGKVLTSDQVTNVAKSILSDKAKQQLRINGWANYDGGVRSTADVTASFQSFVDTQAKGDQAKVAAIELQISALGEGSPDKVRALEAQKEALKNHSARKTSVYQDWINRGDKANMYTTMESESVLGRFGEVFAINDVKATLVDNKWELAKYEEELKRETQRQKALLDAQAKADEKTKKEASAYQVITPTLTPDPVNRAAELDQQVVRYNQGYKDAVTAAVGSLPEPDRKNLETLYESSNKEQSKEAFLYDQLMGVGGGASGLLTPDQKVVVETAKLRRDRAVDLQTEARQFAFNTLESQQVDKLVDNLLDSGFFTSNEFQMLDDNGRAIAVKDYLRSKGVTDGEGLKNNTEAKAAVLKSIYAERIMDDRKGFDGLRLRAAEALQKKGIRAFGETPEENAAKIKELREKLVIEKGEDLYSKRLIELFNGDEEAALNYVNSARNQGLDPQYFYGLNAWKSTDDTYSDDSFVDSWVNEDAVRAEAGKYLNDNQLTATTNMVVVSNTSEQGTKLMEILNSQPALITAGLPGAEAAKDQPLTLQDLGNGIARVYMKVKDKDGKIATNIAELPVGNLPERVQAEIKFGNQRDVIDQTNMQPVAARAVFYEDTDAKNVVGLANMSRGAMDYQQAKRVATKGGLQRDLMQQYGPVMGSPSQPTVIGQAVTNMINSDNLIAEVIKLGDGMYRNKLSYLDPQTQKPMGIHVYDRPISPAEYQQQTLNTKFAPQLLVADFIHRVLTDVIRSGGQITPEAQKIINIYGGGVPN